MMKGIEAKTCVDGWLLAAQYLLTKEAEDWRAYNIVLEIADPLALPATDRAVVDLLNRFLIERGGLPVNTVVNTIFPAQLYLKHGAAGVYERYMADIYPEVRQHPDCSWGTYAQRIICRSDGQGGTIYPLRDLVFKIKTQIGLPGPNRAVYELGILDPLLEIPIYDPTEDRTRPIGGPCLSHISVKLAADKRVMLNGFYRSHYYVQRALGNLLGLAHLQHFIARETGLEMGPLVCHSSMAQLELKPKKKGSNEGWGKSDFRELLKQCVALRWSAAA